MKVRNRFIMFFLFGSLEWIYFLYWLVSVQNGIHDDNTAGNSMKGSTVLLLCIFTCGLYLFIWQWKVGTYLKKKGQGDLRCITLLLSLLLVGIILNPLLIQGQINRLIKRNQL